MNYELLRSVAQDILDEKLKLDMDVWCSTRDLDLNKTAEEAACGTTACVAGWLAIKGGTAKLTKDEGLGEWTYSVGEHGSFEQAAFEALGVGDYEENGEVQDNLDGLFHSSSRLIPFILRRLVDGEDVIDALETGYDDYIATQPSQL